MQSPEPKPDGRIDVAPLLRRTALGVLAVVVLLGGAGWWFREPLAAVSRGFVGTLGGPGIALGFFLPDATALPLPHDLFLALGVLGGLPTVEIVAWASAGSILGGCTAFGASQLVRRIPWVQERLDARAAEARAMVERYGVTALALGALTPLPYSLMAWSCALLGMRFPTFLAISLLRIVRVALYLAAVQAGVVSLGLG